MTSLLSQLRPPGCVVESLACQLGGSTRAMSNRAKRGLYAGKDIGFGNMVSHSNRKTRRSFKPNVQHKRVWSDALQTMVPFNLTTTALRMVDKWGGLDNYLLNTSDKKLDSVTGIEVKRRIEARLERLKVSRAEHITATAGPGESKAEEDMKGLPDWITKDPPQQPPTGHDSSHR